MVTLMDYSKDITAIIVTVMDIYLQGIFTVIP